MSINVATVYNDDDPDSSRRYVRWTRHTLYSDGSITLSSGTDDSDWESYSETANEVNPTQNLIWTELSPDIQQALREDAIVNNKLLEFEQAVLGHHGEFASDQSCPSLPKKKSASL